MKKNFTCDSMGITYFSKQISFHSYSSFLFLQKEITILLYKENVKKSDRLCRGTRVGIKFSSPITNIIGYSLFSPRVRISTNFPFFLHIVQMLLVHITFFFKIKIRIDSLLVVSHCQETSAHFCPQDIFFSQTNLSLVSWLLSPRSALMIPPILFTKNLQRNSIYFLKKRIYFYHYVISLLVKHYFFVLQYDIRRTFQRDPFSVQWDSSGKLLHTF